MKRFLLYFFLLCGFGFAATAQVDLNDAADNIVGKYSGEQSGEPFKVQISKLKDGGYRGQVIWMKHDCDDEGNKLLDKKNPDKSLRNQPCDRVVLFSGLKYNADKHCWDGTKIYDPQRGVRAKLKVKFEADGRLALKGSLLGISETVRWKKL